MSQVPVPFQLVVRPGLVSFQVCGRRRACVLCAKEAQPMTETASGDVMVQMPGPQVLVSYAAQRKQDRSLRVA